ncbi:hypothetical protein Nepgr_012120 [Nepenthes gracilis]|uniref:Uncharacterized protein n=1 Tax=Nepenthes gracilis TaxID=150966 RepID=A0AAD3SGK0_NEPGR|nr:hypothetical protein Nepgr_012120 [Nepenthes gracilis]
MWYPSDDRSITGLRSVFTALNPCSTSITGLTSVSTGSTSSPGFVIFQIQHRFPFHETTPLQKNFSEEDDSKRWRDGFIPKGGIHRYLQNVSEGIIKFFVATNFTKILRALRIPVGRLQLNRVDGVLSLWDSQTSLILSLFGVVGRTGRNGGAIEMRLRTTNTTNGIGTGFATVQESLWKAILAIPSLELTLPSSTPPPPSLQPYPLLHQPWLCPEATHPTVSTLCLVAVNSKHFSCFSKQLLPN